MKSKNDREFKHIQRAWEDICDSRGTGEDKAVDQHAQGISEKVEKPCEVLAESGIEKLQKRSYMNIDILHALSLNVLIHFRAPHTVKLML